MKVSSRILSPNSVSKILYSKICVLYQIPEHLHKTCFYTSSLSDTFPPPKKKKKTSKEITYNQHITAILTVLHFKVILKFITVNCCLYFYIKWFDTLVWMSLGRQWRFLIYGFAWLPWSKTLFQKLCTIKSNWHCFFSQRSIPVSLLFTTGAYLYFQFLSHHTSGMKRSHLNLYSPWHFTVQ